MPDDSERLIDPQLLPLLRFFPPLQLTDALLPTLRQQPADASSAHIDAASPVEAWSRQVAGPPRAPEVRVEFHAPRTRAEPLPCVLHMHGGGFVMGHAAGRRAAHRQLAADADCAVVSVDYRLAPETRHPGALEDCYAVLKWLFASAAELGIDARRIGVMGESAGGGLAAALTLLARDRGEHPLSFQHLIYPMLDDRTCTSAEPNAHAGKVLWTRENNTFGWASLLGIAPDSPHVSPYAAPARAVDLSDLPPAYLATGALDLFIDEDIEYARRLIRHGVPVELHVYPGAFHCFDLSPDARVAQDARRDGLAALIRAFARPA